MFDKTDYQEKMNSMIEFLLANANPSIKLRIKEEIIHDLSTEEKQELLDQIYRERNILTILNAQKENGFIGNNLHGSSGKLGSGQFDNQETGIRYPLILSMIS